MIYLTAEKQATQYFFRVQLDETKPETEDNTREFSWVLTPPTGQTEADYIAMMKREIPLLVAEESARLNPQSTPAPTPLAGF